VVLVRSAAMVLSVGMTRSRDTDLSAFLTRSRGMDLSGFSDSFALYGPLKQIDSFVWDGSALVL